MSNDLPIQTYAFPAPPEVMTALAGAARACETWQQSVAGKPRPKTDQHAGFEGWTCQVVIDPWQSSIAEAKVVAEFTILMLLAVMAVIWMTGLAYLPRYLFRLVKRRLVGPAH